MERDTSYQYTNEPQISESNVNIEDAPDEHINEADIANEVCQVAVARSFRKAVKVALKMETLNHNEKKSYTDLLSLPTK